LAGRAGVIRLLGLSVRELLSISSCNPFLPTLEKMTVLSNSDYAFDYDKLVSFIHKGFFPELYEIESSLHDWADYYSSYFQTYIEKDVKDVLNIQDEAAFIKFVRTTASLTAQTLNLTTVAEICAKDVKTVRSWLSVLESCGLIYLMKLTW
jgi:predicted AAA+ superfamily ATPase